MMAALPGEIVGILLAAGQSKRFAADKLIHPLGDGTPLAVAAARILMPACDRVVSILRPEQIDLRRMLGELGVDVRIDRACVEGLGSSLACAVRATPSACGWLVALGDMPFVGPATVGSVAALLRSGTALAAPICRGRRGHPVGFSSRWYAELSRLRGDGGPRWILDQHPDQLTLVEVDDRGICRDVDRPRDLDTVREPLSG